MLTQFVYLKFIETLFVLVVTAEFELFKHILANIELRICNNLIETNILFLVNRNWFTNFIRKN